MKKMGRPRKIIDKRTFEGLCRIQCTLEDMCAVFECDNKTLENWCKHEYKQSFSEIFSKKRRVGFVSLRRKLFLKGVEDGDSKILIYLADNWLGMSKKIEVSNLSAYDLSKLSEEELETLKQISFKADVTRDT